MRSTIYTTTRASLSTSIVAGIETDVSHIFDKPSASLSSSEAQKVFIRAIEGGQLPLVGTQFANNPNVAVTDPNDANVGRINPKLSSLQDIRTIRPSHFTKLTLMQSTMLIQLYLHLVKQD